MGPFRHNPRGQITVPFIITYRHKGETAERSAEASTATAAVKLHASLETSEAEVLFTQKEGQMRTLGELKNEAGREASGTNGR